MATFKAIVKAKRKDGFYPVYMSRLSAMRLAKEGNSEARNRLTLEHRLQMIAEEQEKEETHNLLKNGRKVE